MPIPRSGDRSPVKTARRRDSVSRHRGEARGGSAGRDWCIPQPLDRVPGRGPARGLGSRLGVGAARCDRSRRPVLGRLPRPPTRPDGADHRPPAPTISPKPTPGQPDAGGRPGAPCTEPASASSPPPVPCVKNDEDMDRHLQGHGPQGAGKRIASAARSSSAGAVPSANPAQGGPLSGSVVPAGRRRGRWRLGRGRCSWPGRGRRRRG